ncbi:MAG TPA: M56 family metallopeptidase [Mucilaginibacter sp.]
MKKLIGTQSDLLEEKYKLVAIKDSNVAFSFFNYLFIGTNVNGTNTIIRHELVHIRQKHSWDIIFLEIIKIINWFNPFIYLLQISLKAVHEYIADEQTAYYENNAHSYSSFLVNNAYGLNGSSITHSFFNYNLLKKRIIMLHQKRSGNLARLKYLSVLPVCAGLLCASTLSFSKTYGWLDLVPQTKTDTPQSPESKANKTIKYNNEYTNSKGYKIHEQAWLVDGNFIQRVSITDKEGNSHGYDYSKMSAGERKMVLEKYGYQFQKIETVKLTLTPPPPIDDSDMPPPPPPPAKPIKTGKLNENQARWIVNVNTNVPPVPESPTDVKDPQDKISPPPAPQKSPFDSLYRYIARHVRYPLISRTNRVAGTEIVALSISDGKIEDVKMMRGLDQDLDAELTRVINNFAEPLDAKTANYILPVVFVIEDAKGNMVGSSPNTSKNKAAGENIASPVYYLDEVIVTTYL